MGRLLWMLTWAKGVPSGALCISECLPIVIVQQEHPGTWAVHSEQRMRRALGELTSSRIVMLKDLFHKACLKLPFLLTQGFSVDLEPVLELALVDQADFKLTEILLHLLPKCWE